jgi:hypothetical protein
MTDPVSDPPPASAPTSARAARNRADLPGNRGDKSTWQPCATWSTWPGSSVQATWQAVAADPSVAQSAWSTTARPTSHPPPTNTGFGASAAFLSTSSHARRAAVHPGQAMTASVTHYGATWTHRRQADVRQGRGAGPPSCGHHLTRQNPATTWHPWIKWKSGRRRVLERSGRRHQRRGQPPPPGRTCWSRP